MSTTDIFLYVILKTAKVVSVIFWLNTNVLFVSKKYYSYFSVFVDFFYPSISPLLTLVLYNVKMLLSLTKVLLKKIKSFVDFCFIAC